MGQNGRGYTCDGSAYTLNTVDQHAVAFAANQRGEVRLFGGDGQTVGAIPANQSGKQVQAIAFKQGAGSKAGSVGASCEVSPTLTASESGTQLAPAVCIADDTGNAAIDTELCGTLKCGGSPPSVSNGFVVRRLTPRECERLQGFPDDWTLIPWRGKQAEECPDGPRYKALGNSMAVPVMRWIGMRIEEVDSRQ